MPPDGPNMDIVYFVKLDPENDSEELRYSLRSLSNIPHGKVFIVGEKPDWVINVDYIPVPQSGSKNENVSTSLRTAVESNLISNDFILMNDDFFVMKKIAALPMLNFGYMKDIIQSYDARYRKSTRYIEAMKSLYDALVAKGFSHPISYELHIPMAINRQRAQKVFNEARSERIYQFRSYYGNCFGIGGEAVSDVKIFIDSIHNHPEFERSPDTYLQSQTFLSSTGGAFKRGRAGDYIRDSFPDRSVYESY